MIEVDGRSISPRPERDAWASLKLGLRGRCPACGEGRIFRAYLKVNDACPNCGEELHHHRADDAPPYFTILIASHVIGALILAVDERWPDLHTGIHMALWPVLTLVLCLWLLPIAKGGLVAYQWAMRMHGFETAPARDNKKQESALA